MACSLGMSLGLNWQDQNNNYSSVHARVWITTSNGSYNGYSPSGSGSVDGQGFSFSHSFGKNTTTTLYEGDFNIYHPADGRKGVIGASVSFNTGVSAGTISASASLALPDIPRASQPSVNNNNPILGNAITINTNRASTSFTHNLSWWCGSLSGTIANGVADGVNWTVPTQIATMYPNDIQGAVGIHCDTYSGGTYIGRKDVYITAKIPTSYVPSFTSLVIAKVDNGVPNSWGVYVKGYSKVTATISGAKGSNGSTIRSYSIVVEDVGSSDKSTDTIGPINKSGTVKIKATVTDTRGRTATKETTITVIDYSPPSLQLTAERCLSNGTVDGEGTYVKITPTYSFASVSGKNSITVKNFSVNGETNTTCASGSSVVLGKGALSVAKEYIVTAYVKEALVQTQTVSVKLPIGQIFMHFPEEFYGLGINRYCTTADQVQIGGLDLNLIDGNLIFGGVKLIDFIYPVGSQIYNAKKDFNPNTLYKGTTWIRIKGYLLAGINEEDTQTTSYLSFNHPSGTKLGASYQELRAWIGAYDGDAGALGYQASPKVSGQYFAYGFRHGGFNSNIDFGRINHSTMVSNTSGQTNVSIIQPTQLTYIWERTE